MRCFLGPVIGLCLWASAAMGETTFVPGFDDLPLAPGLTAASEEPLAFITSGGRIVEAHASGRLTPEAVFGFYATTLPQLGWRTVSDGAYVRENESLLMTVADGPSGGITVEFRLTPTDSSP